MQSSNAFRRMFPGSTAFIVGLALALFVVLSLISLYLDFVSHALTRLQLSPRMVSFSLVAILIGGLVNIPLHRTRYTRLQLAEWVTFYQRWGQEPFPIGMLRGNTIAINVGGAIVPLLIAFGLIIRLAAEPFTLAMLLVSSIANVVVCFRLGRIVTNVGIMLPGWVAPFLGIAGAWLLLPAESPHYASFAFVSAVLGPFIGADLMNLKNVDRFGTGTLSIGGAGPLDGIVLSGVLAAWLA